MMIESQKVNFQKKQVSEDAFGAVEYLPTAAVVANALS